MTSPMRMGLAEELRALAQLHAERALSDEEFASAKAVIISRSVGAVAASGAAPNDGAAAAAGGEVGGMAPSPSPPPPPLRLRTVAAHVVAGGSTEVEHTDVETQRAAGPSIRAATVEDIPSLARVTHYSRLYSFTDSVEEWLDRGAAQRSDRQVLDDQIFGAFVGTEAVASILSHPWRCGGGSSVQFGAIAGVATIPEYRRLGLLRAMTTTLFAEMRGRGQSVAALWASQSAIYQRYGYISVPSRSYDLDTTEISFVDGDGGSCTVARQPKGAALEETMKAVYEGFIAGRVCALDWLPGGPGPGDRMGTPEMGEGVGPTQRGLIRRTASSGSHVAVATSADGVAKAYVVYSIADAGPDSQAYCHPTRNQQITVAEIAWLDIDAYRSIWSFLAKHDLVGHVAVSNLPIDDPAPIIFQEPRLLRMSEAEGTWWRIIDVVGALEGRRYIASNASHSAPTGESGSGAAAASSSIYSSSSSSSLTLRVSDDERLAPWNIGTFSLTIDAEGSATCQQITPDDADADPAGVDVDVDVMVGIAGLTSLWSGVASARSLSMWGLLEVASDEALQRADAMFATPAAPHCFDYW